MKFQLICILVYITHALADDIHPPAARPNSSELPPPASQKPFGAYYCQARCLAACLETFLASNLDECQKFCPPFDDNLLCPRQDAECWNTCGVPTPISDPAPESPMFTTSVGGQGQEEKDPFLIDLAWTGSPNATLYIVEFYPLNRTPKQGETNFFQAMTTSMTYTVRKEDECVEYDARVIAVNSHGISDPTYINIAAPAPTMNADEHFVIRNMQRDPWSPDMITVTIDYSLPVGWPIDDIDISTLRLTASDCKGPLKSRTFGAITNPTSNLNPSYNAIIGKTPTTAIQLSFFDDVVQSDCLFQMRVAQLTTRCNTTTTYDPNPLLAPGVDFRISCDSIEGICDNETTILPSPPPPAAPIPVPSAISVDPEVVVPPLSFPGYLPPGIDQPDAKDSNGTGSSDVDDMPTPPPLPLFIIGESQQATGALNAQPIPPGGASISVIDVAQNGTSVETMAIIPQTMLPPLCELDMLDVIPGPSPLSPSVVDLTVQWLERQPLPPPPPPSYFSIRYGPIVRNLVDDARQPSEIIPGYETIVRTGQQSPLPDPTRQIAITGIQRNSLLKIQICAVFDPNSEMLIQWDTVQSRRIDLAALEPFLELENASPADIQNAAAATINSAVPSVLDPAPPTQSINDDMPLIITVNADPDAASTMYWITVLASVMLVILTAAFVFMCLRRTCNSRRMVRYVEPKQKPMFIVNTIPAPPPTMNEVVKVPLP